MGGLFFTDLHSGYSTVNQNPAFAQATSCFTHYQGSSYLTAQQSYFHPDSTWSFQLGEKARFADRRITVNADIYYVKWTDIQQEFTLTCGYSFFTNAGDAKSYGPELELSAKLTDNLTANLSGA